MAEERRSKPSFFKVLLNEDFTLQLRLPAAFVQKHGNILHENAVLGASSGESWVVKLEHIGEYEKCHFTRGWPKFAKDLGLKMGEFLVFWLVGKSTFDVLVFGISGCERVISNFNSEFESSDSDEEVQILSKYYTFSARGNHDSQNPQQVLDLSVTRNDKKSKEMKQTSNQIISVAREKKALASIPLRRRTRLTTQLPHVILPIASTPMAGTMIVENDDSSSASDPSAGQEIESDYYVHLATPLVSLKRRKVLTESHSDDMEANPPATGSHSQDLSARRAMVSLVEETLDFDFSFLDSRLFHEASSSSLTSGLELATAKASLRHFLNMNLNALGAMEKTIVLSAASILKSSPDFPQTPLYDILNNLHSMFSAFQDSSLTCSETLIQMGDFKAQKEKLDSMLAERKSILTNLQ
ncbi:uncharacterized protein [Primulina eburnea]|uniref:uncharacterized protein isoform X2 n=1 Tax=Primulina eburnea TaxID=1245227 RepID=UPI003C6C5C40